MYAFQSVWLVFCLLSNYSTVIIISGFCCIQDVGKEKRINFYSARITAVFNLIVESNFAFTFALPYYARAL